LLKVACSGLGMSRTRKLSVTSPILNHYATAPTTHTLRCARIVNTFQWTCIVTEEHTQEIVRDLLKSAIISGLEWPLRVIPTLFIARQRTDARY